MCCVFSTQLSERNLKPLLYIFTPLPLFLWGSGDTTYWPFQGDASFVDLFCKLCFMLVCRNAVSVLCSLVVTWCERADLLAVVCAEFCHFPNVSWSTSESGVGLAPCNWFKPSSKIFYWPFQGGTSFVDLLCFCSVLCSLCLCARLFICALWSPAGKGLTSWLSFVVSNCEFVTFPLVSWVRCGTWLYWFLIFAP